MNPDEVERLIEAGFDAVEVKVSTARGAHDDDHLAATVVSPVFEDTPLVQQHQLVYDALGDHMTTDIHALELSTFTPDEYAARTEE